MTTQLATRNDTSLEGLMRVGAMLAKSGYFKDATQEAQAVAKVLAGAELGVGPVAAMTGIFIVKEKVTLSANLMAALVKASNRYDYRVKQIDADGCVLQFFEHGKLAGESSFTKADAKTANLVSGNWLTFPRNMMFSRAMTNGVKLYCPDISVFPIYTPDELGADVDGETGQMVVQTPPPLSMLSSEARAIAPPRPEPAPEPEPEDDKPKRDPAQDAFFAAATRKLSLKGLPQGEKRALVASALGIVAEEGVLGALAGQVGWDYLRQHIEGGQALPPEARRGISEHESPFDDRDVDMPDDTAAQWSEEMREAATAGPKAGSIKDRSAH